LRQRERQKADAIRQVDLQRRQKTPQDVVARIVQRVPRIPVVLNGVTYDPEDITRFNGRELHFIAAPAGDHVLAVDDRDLMQNWWRLTYLEQYRRSGPSLAAGAQPMPNGSPAQAREFHPRTWFYEDINLGGSQIYLDANRGYYDLTEVSMGVFGDWNDEISSFWMIGTHVTVLHEDVRWTGQTFTVVRPHDEAEFKQLSLLSVGWNDRASSLETW
jgi:hypothetical protein